MQITNNSGILVLNKESYKKAKVPISTLREEEFRAIIHNEFDIFRDERSV